MREFIRQLWKQSKKYKISRDYMKIPSVSREELAGRINSTDHVLKVLDKFIVPLQKVLKDREYTLGFIDSDGVILKVYQCAKKFVKDFAPGKIWTERYVGTTAIGVALTTKKTSIVCLKEHDYKKLQTVFAVSKPIIIHGEFLGVLTLAIEEKGGLEYLINLMSVIVGRVEEQLILQESFCNTAKGEKSFEEVFRTFIHEIKNPLANIRAFLQLQQIKSGNRAEYDKIIQEVDRISEMVENFRYICLPKDIYLTKINLTNLIKNIYEALKYMFNLKGCQLKLYIAEECWVMGNENKLKQVFLNIIKNAYEALDEEGLVEIRVKKGEKDCQVEIYDNGEGIASEELKLIFQPFYTTKVNGYGLGLAVCQEIISYHNGKIIIDSEKNVGTTVTITLPCVGF
ncbi:hypothetical protein BBF96_04185 [Anoxybacter fermentans]|uniref:histidine kinase n=1 Tax=Anoxybacter fermentans TaxID=1323375 RepID=A0A3S9SWG3_9FIRM|nr:HAMP domain-containing sensor histidine kinase [Anoxybacter fermentans]AZR72656.1 hypothetical protein BBF96_04185 [Anoxybacter fermentans]